MVSDLVIEQGPSPSSRQLERQISSLRCKETKPYDKRFTQVDHRGRISSSENE